MNVANVGPAVARRSDTGTVVPALWGRLRGRDGGGRPEKGTHARSCRRGGQARRGLGNPGRTGDKYAAAWETRGGRETSTPRPGKPGEDGGRASPAPPTGGWKSAWTAAVPRPKQDAGGKPDRSSETRPAGRERRRGGIHSAGCGTRTEAASRGGGARTGDASKGTCELK